MKKRILLAIWFFSSIGFHAGAQVALENPGYSAFTSDYPLATYTEYAAPASNIPECTPPRNVSVVEAGSHHFTVSWDGPEAQQGGIAYLFRYKSEQETFWKEISISEGRSVYLQGLDHSLRYDVEVKKICPSVGNEPELASHWVGLQGISLPSPRSISLPPFDCGVSFTPDPCQGSSQNTITFDTLYIGGIPVLVDTMWTGNVSEFVDWFGFGWAPLPFGNQMVRVEWGGDIANLVSIDSSGVLCSGVMRGVSDDPSNYPNLNPGPAQFGGEICIPPNSGNGYPWDDNGFGEDGAYIKQPPYEGYMPGDLIDTSGILDPWGFDVNGIHFDTGTNTNEYGCTQEQLNSQPQPPPCDSLPPPYYWVDEEESAPTQAGNALANEVSDSLSIWLVQILEDLEIQYQDTIDARRVSCNGIRSNMNTLVAALNYGDERKFLFGNGPDLEEEYFKEGMHQKFIAAPQPMIPPIERNPNQVLLEEKHIDLYHCDKQLHVFIHLVEIFEELRTTRLEELIENVVYKIQRFSSAQAELYSNQDSMYNWLIMQAKLASNLQYANLHSSVGPKPPHNQERWAAIHNAPAHTAGGLFGSYLASGNSDEALDLAFIQSLDLWKDDISFQYRQGWSMVGGIHRAYYMEAISKERNKAVFMPSALLTANDSTLMPIIVKNRATDGRLYQMYLDEVVFYTTHASLDAYILLEMPNNGQKLLFEAQDIHFGPTGPKIFPMTLKLGNDVGFRISNAAKLIIKGTENTFVSVDCKGFAGIGIEAEVEICRDYVIPVDPATGELMPDPSRVRGYIQTFFPTWNDFYLEINMDPFVVTGVEDIQWHIDQVVIDFSDVLSPGSPAAPPPGYNSPFAGPGGFHPCWKGFYMGNFSAALPAQFSEGPPITVGVQDVVIDDMGFSGQVYLANVLPLNDGNAGGWAFSIDTIDIIIIANQLQDGGLSGLIHVPLISSANDCNTGPATASDCLRYSAFVEPGNKYHFAVFMPASEYCIDMWKGGSVKLYNNTSVAMKLEDGDFEMLATLYGEVSISDNAGGGGIGFDIGKIIFEKVQVSNKSPWFSPGIWKFPQLPGVNLGGFGLSLNDIRMETTEEGDPSLKFAAKISVINDDIPLTAGGGFRIVGEKVEHDGRHRWKFKSFKVDKIYVDGGFAGVAKIQGLLEFFEEDPTYGTGFRGGVGVAFEGLNASVTALAHFGKKETYKYFFVDALACITIPIVPGIDLTGFGGGIYYHMNRPNSEFSLPACVGVPTIPLQLGVSLSGITYVPDSTKLLGLKATVALAVAKETALNVNATYEVLFVQTANSLGFGLGRIDFYGNARLLAAANKQASPAESSEGTPPQNGASLNANVKWTLNFQNRTFSGAMETFLNTPGNFISGSGPNGRFSQAEIYFGPDRWYLRMGRPSARNGLKIQVPGLKNPLVEFGSYFQIGNGGIDAMPDIPGEIQAGLVGFDKPFSIVNNRGALVHSGGGFIMGSHAAIDLLDIDIKVVGFNVMEAEVKGMLGFDIAVLDWGESAVCAGSGQPVGINGWYAQGQIYGGFFANLKVVGINLATVSFAGALEARFPNPFWAKGALSASASTSIGGVKVNLNVELGEKCEIVGVDNPVTGIPLIERVLPANKMVGVSVEANPKVSFLMPVGKSFGIPELGAGSVYTPKLDHAKLYYKGILIPATGSWNENGTEITLSPSFFLPANDTLVLDVLAHIDSSGVSIHSEHRRDTFYTGGPVSRIDEDNVAGSYPFDGQYNFYRNEIGNRKGYIQLKKGQPSLFYDMDGYRDLKVRWRRGGGEVFYLQDASYNAMQSRIEFTIPVNQLTNEELYVVDLVRIPMPAANFGNGAGGAAASLEMIELQALDDAVNLARDANQFPIPIPGLPDNTPPPAPHGAQSVTKKTGEIPLSSGAPPSQVIVYAMHFRTSRYDRFIDKIADWSAGKQITSSATSNFHNEAELEPLDKFELQDYKGSGPLVTASANLAGNNWYHNEIYPAIYQHFPNGPVQHPIFSLSRPLEPRGVPPFNGVEVSQNHPQISNLWIRPAMAKLGELPAGFSANRDVRVSYKLGGYFGEDYVDFWSDARLYLCNYMATQIGQELCPPEEYEHPCECLSEVSYYPLPKVIVDMACDLIPFPQPPADKYKIFLKYRLPGMEGVHSIMAAEVERQ